MPRTISGKQQMDVVARQVANQNTEPKHISPVKFLPSGSTLLNLALSGHHDGGWPAGRICNLIGDSSSGKSFIALTMLAEMASQQEFDKYHLVYDDVEAANSFNMEHLFGENIEARIISPSYNPDLSGAFGEPINSHTIQDFEFHIHTYINEGSPFVYILDSFDALTSDEETSRAEETRQARIKGKKGKTIGSYKMEKAKGLSELLRKIKRHIEETNSLLIVVSQTRDNINPMSFVKKTRSGGRALEFYSSIELWTAEKGKMKRKELPVGIKSKVKISKNKITGMVRTIELPIYYDYGVDSITANIWWMLEQECWKKRGQTILAPELKLEGTMSKLIEAIERKGLEDRLSRLVGKRWGELEKSILVQRKRKYT